MKDVAFIKQEKAPATANGEVFLQQAHCCPCPDAAVDGGYRA
jgi:hypothetical protein